MNKQKITKDAIVDAIQKTADIIVQKHQLYEDIKRINGELKALYESAPPVVGSFGFITGEGSQDKNNVTGFVGNQNISYIAQLEKEMGIEPTNTINEENETLKLENEQLRKELEELKALSNK